MIFHLDLDSFYVSAERLHRPELRGIPVAVGGRGVLSSASYEARKYGIRSAMPTAQAMRILPSLTVVRPNFELYTTLSRQVFDVVDGFSPVVEKVSIDEAYLDMRGTQALFGDPREAAERMRAEIRKLTGLTASVGIGANRRIAKIASDFAKPDGVFFVAEGQEREFLGPLEVRRVPGIGPTTEGTLQREGIFRVRDLFDWTDERLARRFGDHFGEFLARIRDGQGSIEFFEESKTRSMSREETFAPPLMKLMELKNTLWDLVKDVGQDLRSEREDDDSKVYAHAVRLKLRYANFDTPTRSRVLKTPTRVDREIYTIAEDLLVATWESSRPIRLLGVGVVLGDGQYQKDLFDQGRNEKAEKMDELKDSLREKFGDRAAISGRDVRSTEKKPDEKTPGAKRARGYIFNRES